MDIIFNARTYNPDREIDNLVRDNYIQAILSIYNSLKDTLDLSLLNSIIVPEDYKTELFEFQRNNGHSEFITENEYGRGFAQVVSSKSDRGEIVYNVIIDKNIILSLLPDNFLQSIKDNLNDDEQYKTFCYTRQLAINTLCHEFGHIYEYSLNRKIEWIRDREMGTDLHSQYLELAKQCWSEYFACRTVSSTFPLKPEDCIEIINTCNDVEKMLQEKRSKYNRRIITLEDFVTEFHKYTTFILKKIASAHGNLYCLDESREDIIQIMEDNLRESYVKAIWSEYGRALNKLYKDYSMWKDATVFDDVIFLIEKYYNQFDIY
jgi:hypothetical protein